jgi:hypothetical protein
VEQREIPMSVQQLNTQTGTTTTTTLLRIPELRRS